MAKLRITPKWRLAPLVAAGTLALGLAFPAPAKAEKRGNCSFFESGVAIPYFANTYGDILFSPSKKAFAIERKTEQCEDNSEDGSDVSMTKYDLLEVRGVDGVSKEWFVGGKAFLVESFKDVLEYSQEHGWSGEKVSAMKAWKARAKKDGFKRLKPLTVSPNGACSVWNQHSKKSGRLAIAVLKGDTKLLELTKAGPIVASSQLVSTYFVPETKTFLAHFRAKGVPKDVDTSIKLTRRTKKQLAATEGWLEVVQVSTSNAALAPCF